MRAHRIPRSITTCSARGLAWYLYLPSQSVSFALRQTRLLRPVSLTASAQHTDHQPSPHLHA